MAEHIAILGAGLGWYVAAIRAAQLGARVTVIELRARGAVCLNSACIPSKALLSVDALGDKVRKAAPLGLQVCGPVTYDLPRMVARKNQVVAVLTESRAREWAEAKRGRSPISAEGRPLPLYRIEKGANDRRDLRHM